MQAPRIDAQTLPPPPGIIGSLRTGFDVIAGNVTVILMPLALDLLLWLGPRLSIDRLIQPFLPGVAAILVGGSNTENFPNALDSFTNFFKAFNLLGILRTFPIGISSLMSGLRPTTSPLGAPILLEVGSILEWLGLCLLMLVLGLILGALYFSWVAALAVPESAGGGAAAAVRAILQSMLYAAIWMLVSTMVGFPIFFILSILTAINALLGQGALLLLGFLSMWLIVPIFFSPHGIFVRKQNAFASILGSFQMTRFTLPSSSLFVLTIFLIGVGLNLLWSLPNASSWLAFVGIFGHAFITTALLASSFVYYRDMTTWLETALARLRAGLPTQQA